MRRAHRRRFQRRIEGGRSPLPSSVEERIWQAVERTADRFDVSRSFVVSVALADTMGVSLEAADRYDRPRRRSVA